jgi:hypothetical protein
MNPIQLAAVGLQSAVVLMVPNQFDDGWPAPRGAALPLICQAPWLPLGSGCEDLVCDLDGGTVAAFKKVTAQTLIGEEGVNLIERRVLEMGHLFHPRRIDHGIDGHIDLVEPGTGRHLNQTILVQSKAHDRSLQQESATSFVFTCDQRDLEHWLGGNAPVIVVVSHPKKDEAWWIDIKASFADPRARASRRLVVDKASQSFDKKTGAALLRLGMPVSSGLYLQPPPRTEVLDTNLLKIVDLPTRLYLAPAVTGDYATAGKRLESAEGTRWPFILRDGLVISFADLSDCRLEVLCAGDVETHDVAEWANSADESVQFSLQDLMTRTIQDAYPELRWHKTKKHVHFRATRGLTPLTKGKRKGAAGRTMFGPHMAQDGSIGYYHHAAVKMRMRRIDQSWFCELTPDYCFTSNGFEPHRFEDRLLAGIKRLDRHAAVAGWVRTWAEFLRGSDDLFSTPKLISFGELETLTVDAGIDDRYWGPAPVASEPEPDDPEPDDAAPESDDDEASHEVAELLTLFANDEGLYDDASGIDHEAGAASGDSS